MSGTHLISVTGGKVQLQTCGLYRSHHVPVLNSHHVCPESWWRAAHKPVRTPMRPLCANCHNSVHTAIDGILHGWDVTSLPPRCVALARQAFVIAADNGLTPAPTL
jgi:hypothetical protein